MSARVLAPREELWRGRDDEKPKGGNVTITDNADKLSAFPETSTTAEVHPWFAAAPASGWVNEEDIMGPAPGASLRPIAPLFDDGAHGGCGELQPIPTEAPMIEWLAPTDLLVDEAYQRNLGPKSMELIRRIAERWDWRKFKPPIAAWTDNGFEVIDGQHTAIGAASRPDIQKIPVIIVVAANVTDRAEAFVSHNRDNLRVSPMQLHRAMVAAGNDEAVTVERVCTDASVHLVPSAFGSYKWKAGDTVAVDAIRKLIEARGDLTARRVLEVLVQAGCAPIQAAQIKAADMLLTTAQYAEQLELYPQNVADLAQAIRSMGAGAEREARLFAKANCLPMWKALAATWFSKTKKRRRAA